jgi:tetratricopeptide (TPR) repeat protein
MNIETREGLFAAMEQIAAEREAARPIVEKLVASGEPVDDIEIPEGWRTAGMVMELTVAAGEFDMLDPSRSLVTLQLANAIAKSIRPDSYPPPIVDYVKGESWRQIAWAHHYQSAYAAALRASESASKEFRKEPALSHDLATTERGRVLPLLYSGRDNEALASARNSMASSSEFGDQHSIQKCELLIAIVHFRQGAFEVALEKCKELLTRMEGTDDRRTLAALYHNLGVMYSQLGRSHEAVSWLDRARKMIADLNLPVDRTDWVFARIQLADADFATALPLLRRLRESFLRQGMPEEAGLVGLDIVDGLVATGAGGEAIELTERIISEFREADLAIAAIRAVDYLRDLLPVTKNARKVVQSVRSFVEKHRLAPGHQFLPVDDE